MKNVRVLVIASSLVLFCIPALTQVATGTPPFGNFTGGPDVVNLGNLNVNWTIPIRNKPGRGQNFVYNLVYDSSVWYPVGSTGAQSWQPVANWGWQGLSAAVPDIVKANYSIAVTADGTCYTNGPGNGSPSSINEISISNVSYVDYSGTTHYIPFSGTYVSAPGGQYCPASSPSEYMQVPVLDASGLVASFQAGPGGLSSVTITMNTGKNIAPANTSSGGVYSSVDSNGNEITGSNGVFTDTLGQQALSITSELPNILLSYANAGGASTYTATYAPYNIKTNFNCNGVTEYTASNVSLVSTITLPDGTYYQFEYEATPGYSGYVTGRLASVLLPSGGTITYSYTGGGPAGANGIVCADGSGAGLTRTTPDGSWHYSRNKVGAGNWTTTVTQPTYNTVQDQTVSTFLTNGSTSPVEFYEIERQLYAGSSTSGTLLETILTCYEINATNCSSSTGDSGTTVSALTNIQGWIQWPNSSGISSGYVDTYDSDGNNLSHAVYDFGPAGTNTVGSQSYLLQTTNNTYFVDAAGADLLYEIKVTDGQTPPNTLSDTRYAYDATAVVATSGTPSHVSLHSGNLTSIQKWISGSTYQTAYNTYFDTGNVQTSTDFNGTNVTTYTYNSTGCANSFLTGTSTPVKNPAGSVTATLTSSAAWNCVGGVPTSSTDANGNTTNYGYGSDPYWRPVTVTDPAGNVTTAAYPTGSSPNTSSTAMSFNSGLSVNNTAATTDGLGRTLLQQKQQGPSGSYYSTAISYDSRGRVACQTAVPYSAAEGSYTAPSSSNGVCTTYDALGRKSNVTEAGGGTVAYTYNFNDVLVAKGPAPSGENLKQRSLQYNGAGQLASVCEIVTSTLPAGGSCQQNTAQTGYLTQYTYDGSLLTKTQQNVQAGSSKTQTRQISYDGLGRKLSESIPEWSAGTSTPGTATYTYDSISSSNCTTTSPGDLVESTDHAGNVTCNTYDGLHRLLNSTVVSGPYASVTPPMNYLYDVAYSLLPVQNVKGSLAEAYTGTSSAKLTDVVFSQSIQTSGATLGGVVSQMWESTPHSNGYFLTQQISYPNGALGAISASAISPSADGTDATGSITISGSEQSYTWNPCAGYSYPAPNNCPQTIYDNGQAWFTVNGQGVYTAPYGQGSTCSSVASGLAGSINSTPNYPVTAKAAGCVLTVTSVAPGPSSDYAFSAGSFTSDPTYFSSGSFSGGSGTLTGGTNATLVAFGPSVIYGVDGEGRPYSATDGTNNLVTETRYNSASSATSVIYGNGDYDNFGYDVIDRPQTIYFNVTGSNSFEMITGLGWNPNSSLKSMGVTDTSDSTKNQSCQYAADDLSRLASVSCGGAWAQTFAYDAFGNIAKGGSSSYAAAYNAITNQVSSGISPLPTYDANGNQLKSTGLSSITWNAAGQPATVTALSGGPIGGTYDALGRLVETAQGSVYTQFVFSPAGAKMAVVQGGTLTKETIPLPGGETAVYNASGLNYIRHTDWLGSSRLATTWAHAVYSKEAYAPFGETYNEAGTPDRSFTGQDQDTVTGSTGTGIYDFLFRKYDPSAGRWLSPDPAGWSVVDQTDPQSFNRYAYVENQPLSLVDPNGEWYCFAGTSSDGGGTASVTVCYPDDSYGSNVVSNPGPDMISSNGNVYAQLTDSNGQLMTNMIGGPEYTLVANYYFGPNLDIPGQSNISLGCNGGNCGGTGSQDDSAPKNANPKLTKWGMTVGCVAGMGSENSEPIQTQKQSQTLDPRPLPKDPLVSVGPSESPWELIPYLIDMTQCIINAWSN
jgi:RHS repeat-associated protein